MDGRPHLKSRGFSLIELLIVVAIIGLIAVIAIPNLVNAVQRARQARTVSSARAIAAAVSMYQQDFTEFPLAPSWVDVEEIRDHIAIYRGNMDPLDGWDEPFMYQSDGRAYTLVSYGMNRSPDTPWTRGPIRLFTDDIVVDTGTFMQWPEGIQE